MRAWQRMFSDYLVAPVVEEPYTESDYFDYIDGKPRYDGVRSFLASRGIDAARRRPERRPGRRDGLRTRQPEERLLRRRAARRGSRCPTRDRSRCSTTWPTAAPRSPSSPPRATPSRCWRRPAWPPFPRWSSTATWPPAKQLAGKPAPDTFSTRPSSSGCPTERAVVFEDALSGVDGRPGRRLRPGGRRRPRRRGRPVAQAGADLVVADLAELVARDGLQRRRPDAVTDPLDRHRFPIDEWAPDRGRLQQR